MKRANYSGFVGMTTGTGKDKKPAEPVRIEAGKEYDDNHPVVKARPDLFDDVPRG